MRFDDRFFQRDPSGAANPHLSMSITPDDIAWDEFSSQFANELYPEHKTQAIEEFTAERLRSYYVKYPDVLVPAVNALDESKQLHELGHNSAAIVFAASAVELLFKSAVLRPVIYGLVHHDGLAETIVEVSTGGSGFDRYEKLLQKLFAHLTYSDLASVSRKDAAKPLLKECNDLQDKRNKIIHKGQRFGAEESAWAAEVSASAYHLIVGKMLYSLKLGVYDGHMILPFDPPTDDDSVDPTED
jgi:HEPN domain-containing protein